MLSVGIGEIQKNTSIFANLTEAIKIVDKRKKLSLAIVYPIGKQGKISNLAGKYRDRVEKTTLTLEQIKEQSMSQAMKEKYGLST